MSTSGRYGADKLLHELGVTTPEDIDIEAIAEYCQVTVVPQRLHGSAARLIGTGNRGIIVIDSGSMRPRQRFSAAHELGHWMLDRGKLATFVCSEKNFVNDWGADNPERRANRYAADLLLPQFLFEPAAKGKEITFQTVKELSHGFQTSQTATAIRLIEFGSFPAILVCSGKHGRKWSLRGPDIPSAIQLKDNPGPHTDVYKLLSGKAGRGTPGDIEASEWITHPRSRYYSLHEDTVQIWDDLVLTLLWWKDEKQLLDLEDEDSEDLY